MCERTYCRHEHERLCSCPPVACRDALGMAAHLAENMEKVQWSLTYNSLKEIKPYQLCLVGKCRICGGRLCMEQRPVEADSTDGFLAAVYRHLYHFHRSIGQCLPRAAFRTKFVEMFRKEDRAAVEDWLSMPENQSIHAMICGNAKRVYTIVHSWADADQGNFPAPEGMAAFTVKEEARKKLARLVTEEKENRTIPFPTEEYCEEYGEYFWEAYRDGYAAGWFTRYEIIESLLFLAPEDELRTPNPSYSRFTNTRTDLNDCLTSIREDTHLSDAEAGAGKGLFKAVLSLCQDYGIIEGFDCDKVDSVFDHSENHSEALTE